VSQGVVRVVGVGIVKILSGVGRGGGPEHPDSGFLAGRQQRSGRRSEACIKSSASTLGNSIIYTGRQIDWETGLFYYRNRHYHAQLGNFVSRDPIGYTAGDPNLYRYVGNAPANVVDPTGLLRDCEAENVQCNRDCWKAPLSYPQNCYKGKMAKWARAVYCEAKCQALYMECLAENGLEEAGDALTEAQRWLANHPEVVIGTIIVVGGVAFIVATGGAGTPVLLTL
jgi:RHS repeat-associated protein